MTLAAFQLQEHLHTLHSRLIAKGCWIEAYYSQINVPLPSGQLLKEGETIWWKWILNSIYSKMNYVAYYCEFCDAFDRVLVFRSHLLRWTEQTSPHQQKHTIRFTDTLNTRRAMPFRWYCLSSLVSLVIMVTMDNWKLADRRIGLVSNT